MFWNILLLLICKRSRVAQWKRAGPITQRSMDRNHPLLDFFLSIGGSLSFTSPCFPLQIQNRPCWFKNGTDTTLCHYPLIAQLVERRTVVGIVMQISLGRWFESGSRDYFLKDLLSEIPVFLFREGAKRKAKICPGWGSNSRPSDHSWICFIMRLTRCRLRYRGMQIFSLLQPSNHKDHVQIESGNWPELECAGAVV